MKTAWNCELCGATGEIEHADREGVWAVREMIVDDHARARPDCPYNDYRVRVTINPDAPPPPVP